MPRAIWTGTIGFGLVNVPVSLYPATKRKDVRFHEIDRLSGRRIRHQKVVEDVSTPSLTLPTRGRELMGSGGEGESARGREELERMVVPTPSLTLPTRGRESVEGESPLRMVSAPEVLKGFEVSRDRYVTVDRDELEELAPERSRSIDVEQFVNAADVDPIFFDTSYYVVPRRDHERAFGLLVDAMEATKKLAIAWFVLRRKRYLAALRPHGRVMVLATMFHADEVLTVDALEPAAPSDLRKKEKEMAELLVNTLSGPFEPERYPDEYRKRLTALIEGRAASAAPAPQEVVTGTGIQDLMAALQASVEQARAARKGKRTKTAAKSSPKRKKKSA